MPSLAPFKTGTSATPASVQLATISDRFAAQCLDFMICALLLWYIGMSLSRRYGGIGISADGVDIQGTPSITALAVFAVGVFLYFFASEAVFGATVGKRLCRVIVRSEGKRTCGVAAALVRTMFRPIDALIGVVSVATSRKAQRLGDKVAGTTVLKRQVARVTLVPGDTSAAWEPRTKAAIIDVAVLGPFVVAYLFATKSLVMDGRVRITVHGIVLLVLIELVFFYFAALEAILGGTLGKLACDLRVVRIDGQQCGFVESTLRSICRPLDVASAGLVPFLMVRYTPTRRHFGDRLSGTMIVEQEAMGHTALWTATTLASLTVALAIFPVLKRLGISVWAHTIR